MTRKQKRLLVRICLAALLTGIGLFLIGWWQAGFMLAAWAVAGYSVVWSAVRNILHGQLFDEGFLMSLATVCAIAMQEWVEAAAVMLLFQIGELFEQLAVERSRRSLASLMDLRPDSATVLKDGEEVEAEPEEVCVGDVLLVRAGERIPVDGVVIAGESSLDTARITGEAMPVDVSAGDCVASGSVNLSGVLKIRAESAYAQSTVARILTLVETAAEQKAGTERLITKFARYYTPTVICSAALLAIVPPLVFSQPFSAWLYRALTCLVISCPCALVISVPLSFFSGMGAAAKLGVVVKGGVALENLSKVTTAVFDKTGTLTRGSFSVQEVQCESGEESELLRLAALCEQYSNHPIAQAVRDACPSPAGEAKEITELAGKGITAKIDGKTVAVGNAALMQRLGIAPPEYDWAGTVIYVAREGTYLGAICVADTVRETAAEALHRLRRRGVKRTVMLTGDNERSAAHYAKLCGVTDYRAGLLPQDKVSELEKLLKMQPEGEKLAFVGDGVNDVPVLTCADVGIAMGGVGSDAAVEAADAVLLNDDLSKLSKLLRVAKRTCGIAKQNIVFALTVKTACMLLGALGYAPMWLAIFADVGVAVLAIGNALRLLWTRK